MIKIAFPRIAQRLFPSVLWRGDPILPRVALTFDDGPDPVNTPRLLDVLAKFGVKASFFLQGRNVEHYPEVAAQIAAGAHTIGNHTYNHTRLILKSRRLIYQEIKHAEKAITRATGSSPRFFRPPYGQMDWRALKIASEMGYQVVIWSALPWDWKAKTPQEIVAVTLSCLFNGAIIVLHDRTPKLLAALELIIEIGKQRGFSFVSLEQMICSQ